MLLKINVKVTLLNSSKRLLKLLSSKFVTDRSFSLFEHFTMLYSMVKENTKNKTNVDFIL